MFMESNVIVRAWRSGDRPFSRLVARTFVNSAEMSISRWAKSQNSPDRKMQARIVVDRFPDRQEIEGQSKS
jgi:hypothetical protein